MFSYRGNADDIAAHLIVGPIDEPVLPALLASLESWVHVLIVNENSGLEDSANLAILQASAFAQSGRMLLDHTPFVDFAHARNRCLDIHRAVQAGAWVAFVDADEVHTPRAAVIAAKLSRLPESIAIVDGYTRHFFQSPDWYSAIERRMSFFRYHDDLRWEGAVHEQLAGVRGTRLCLPYVYAHYGHLASTYRHAIKERLYHALGRGQLIDDEALQRLDHQAYFATFWPILQRFRGEHPPAARSFIAETRAAQAAYFAESEAYIHVATRSLKSRCVRAFWRANYALRWKSRSFNMRALRLMR